MGRLWMELRDNGKLNYKLPQDMFDFLKYLKEEKSLLVGCNYLKVFVL